MANPEWTDPEDWDDPLTWRDHLTPEETRRLAAIDDERRNLTREHRRIYDRARKRASR